VKTQLVYISIVIASACVFASGCSNGEAKRLIENHEERLDELENMVRPNATGAPDPSTTHQKRIEALEEKVESLEKKLAEQAP